MGCDIHPYIDYDESRGEGTFPDEEKFYTRTFAKLDGGRNYLLFGLLTNGYVRVSDAAGYAPDPKGLPSRLGYETEHDALLWVSEEKWTDESGNCTYDNARSWTGGAHPSSQFVKVEWGRPLVFFDPKIHGELIDGLPEAEGKRFGWKVTHPDWHTHSWLTADELEAALEKYAEAGERIWPGEGPFEVPAECRAWLWALRGLEEGGVVNPRLVFWFDN